MAQSPYADLPASAFWKTAVASCNALQINGLWNPKFSITQSDRVITAGSCFAQHFSRALVARGAVRALVTDGGRPAAAPRGEAAPIGDQTAAETA